jgi:hypothetical protein
MTGFKSFVSASITISGIEMHQIRLPNLEQRRVVLRRRGCLR